MRREDLEQLKRQFPLLDYLQRQHWAGRQAGSKQEFVGLCPLHAETHPSFYVNASKNLFYCHGCRRGGDLIRFVQLYLNLPFRDSVAHLRASLGLPLSGEDELLGDALSFYQNQLHRHTQALDYLHQRGLHDPEIIDHLGTGYAPGGCLCRHLTARGHSFDLLLRFGLVTRQGRDAFFKRIVFPCQYEGRVLNLYGRSIGTAFPHRFLPGSKGGLFAWQAVRRYASVILVEGLFDLAVLWQAGFRNTTCSFGTHPTPEQFSQLCDLPSRQIFITFDSDRNRAGQQAAHALAQRLHNARLVTSAVRLPEDHDPNSFFVAGATAADFQDCLQQAQPYGKKTSA